MRRLLPLLSAIWLASAYPADVSAQDSLHCLILAPRDLAPTLDRLGYHAHDHGSRLEGRYVLTEAIVPEPELANLRRDLPGALVRVVARSEPLRDVVARYPESPDANYKTPAEIEQALRDFETNHPSLARLYDFQSRYGAPFTHDGRRIHLLRISDNPSADEDEPTLVVFTNNHSRELNTVEVALRTARELLDGYGHDAELTRLVNDNEIWIIPTMNPDGLDAVWNINQWWRKNRRDNGDGTFGVDLNRNYPFMWGQCGSSTRTSSDTYQGPSAASEPESQCMIAFADAEGIERLIDIHSYSRDVRPPHNPIVRPRLPAMVSDWYDPFRSDFATAMNYATNTSCCCGTHMEWHHSTRGTFSFLIEMGREFQPRWSSTLSELDRVWPGIRLFLLKPVPLRGHVRSMAGSTPLDARITVAGQSFQDGQEIRSVGRFGRYRMFVADGTWDVTFTAPGHHPETVSVTTSTATTQELDVVLEPALAAPTLTSSGTPRPGRTVQLNLQAPDDAGRPYFLPVSLTPAPLPLGSRELPLTPDFLTTVQLSAPGIFPGASGVVDATGSAQGSFVIPADPVLIGFDFYWTGLTLDGAWPFAVRGIANRVQLTVQP